MSDDVTTDPESSLPALEAQLREMYGRVAYAHKAHEKMADIYVWRYHAFRNIEIALSAVLGGSLLVALYGDSQSGILVSAVFSTVLLGVLLYAKEGALGELAQRHTETAAKLWGHRERMLSLLADLRSGNDETAIRAARDEVNAQLEAVYRAAPRTNAKAYAKAQIALQGDELHFSTEELDHLLPESLRARAPRGDSNAQRTGAP